MTDYFSTSIDEYGEVIQVLSGQNQAVLDMGAHPSAVEVLTINPPSPDSRWDRDRGIWIDRPDRPSDQHIWDKRAGQWTDPRTLQQRISIALESAKQQQSADDAAPITVGARTFDADAESRAKLLEQAIAASIAGAAYSVDWLLADGTVARLTASDLKDVVAALAKRSADVHVQSRARKAQIQAARSVDELSAIEGSKSSFGMKKPLKR